MLEYCYTTRHIGIMWSRGLDPHGVNVLSAYSDSNFEAPRSQGHYIGMNGGPITFVSGRCWR